MAKNLTASLRAEAYPIAIPGLGCSSSETDRNITRNPRYIQSKQMTMRGMIADARIAFILLKFLWGLLFDSLLKRIIVQMSSTIQFKRHILFSFLSISWHQFFRLSLLKNATIKTKNNFQFPKRATLFAKLMYVMYLTTMVEGDREWCGGDPLLLSWWMMMMQWCDK